MNLIQVLLALTLTVSGIQAESIFSPDRNVRLDIGLETGKPYYRVSFEEIVVVEKSFLGLAAEAEDGAAEGDESTAGWTELQTTRQNIEAIRDIDALEELSVRLIKVSSWVELLA
jgi:hypothetical protein